MSTTTPNATSPVVPTYRIYNKADTGYSLTVNGDKVVLAPHNNSDISQYWVKDTKYGHKDGLPVFALVNKFTGQALKQPQYVSHFMQLEDHYQHAVHDEEVLWIERKLTDTSYSYIEAINATNGVLAPIPETWDDQHGVRVSFLKHNPTTDNQKWRIDQQEMNCDGVFSGSDYHKEQTLRIYVKQNPGSSLCAKGQEVLLSPDHPADISQHWVKFPQPQTSGQPKFALVNRYTGQALKQPRNVREDIQLDTYDPEFPYEKIMWTEYQLEDGYYNLTAINNKDHVLDANIYAPSPGNRIKLWDKNGTENQNWKLVPSRLNLGEA